MLTHFDVQNLNNSIEGAGEGFLKRRSMQQQHEAEMSRMAIESQLRDIQQSRYDAQSAHFQSMEDIGQGRNTILAQTESDRNKIAEQGKVAAKDYADAVGSMKDFVQTLRVNRIANIKDPSQGLSQDDATQNFNDAVANLPESVHNQMLQSPMYSGLASGKIDFSTVPSAAELAGKEPTSLKPQMDTVTTDETTPGTPGTPAVPGRKGFLGIGSTADIPEVPPVPGTKTTTTRHVPSGTALPGQVPAGYPAPAAPAAATLAAPSQPGAITPPAAHIAYLQAHPEAAPDFDAKYGAGASAQYLK